MLAETLVPARTDAAPWRWIISAQDDLLWFIGSAIASYALLAFMLLGGSPIAVIIFWAVGFDGTHVFGTMSRTYFDTEERQRRARLLWGSLAFFAVGPV